MKQPHRPLCGVLAKFATKKVLFILAISVHGTKEDRFVSSSRLTGVIDACARSASGEWANGVVRLVERTAHIAERPGRRLFTVQMLPMFDLQDLNGHVRNMLMMTHLTMTLTGKHAKALRNNALPKLSMLVA